MSLRHYFNVKGTEKGCESLHSHTCVKLRPQSRKGSVWRPMGGGGCPGCTWRSHSFDTAKGVLSFAPVELKEGHMGGGSLVTNSMPVTYGCASLHPFLSATGGSLSLMAEQGTDPAVSRMLLGVPIHHNAPPAEFQPKVQGSGRMPLSPVPTRPAAGRCHHCSPQNKPLSTNRIVEGPPRGDWRHSRAT